MVVPYNFIRSRWPTHNSSIALLNNYVYKDKFYQKGGFASLAQRYLSDASHKLPSLDPAGRGALPSEDGSSTPEGWPTLDLLRDLWMLRVVLELV